MLVRKAQHRQNQLMAIGSKNNHKYNVRQYLIFCYRFNVHPLYPTMLQVLVWIEQINIKSISPNTVANKISSIKRYIKMAGGDLTGISHFRVSMVLEALLKSKEYDSKAKEPLSVKQIVEIYNTVPTNINGIIFKAGFLILLYAGLRQSELFVLKKSSYDPKYNLSRGDVQLKGDSIVIKIKWAKNLRRFDKSKQVILKRSNNSELCPVMATYNMLTLIPTKTPQDPFFMFRDRTPIPVNFVKKLWKQILVKINMDTRQYSLHSLRKSLASLAVQQGVNIEQLRAFVGWESRSAHRSYVVHKSHNIVAKAMDNALSIK